MGENTNFSIDLYYRGKVLEGKCRYVLSNEMMERIAGELLMRDMTIAQLFAAICQNVIQRNLIDEILK